MNYKLGQFFVTGGAACSAMFSVWPLEVLKNLNQAETKGVGNTSIERAKYVY